MSDIQLDLFNAAPAKFVERRDAQRDETPGEKAKRRGTAKAEHAADAEWKRLFNVALDTLAQSGSEFTSEDICELSGRPARAAAVGAMMSAAAKAGRVKRVGFRKALRENQHAALISVWRGVAQNGGDHGGDA